LKHKVGDKVRIRTDLKKYFIYGVYTFTDEMSVSCKVENKRENNILTIVE